MAEGQDTPELRPIPGHPNYLAGSDGSIWTFYRFRWGYPTTQGWYITDHPRRLKKMTLGQTGRHAVVVKREDGARVTRNVSRLVAMAFHGLPPEGTECCHNDGDRTNDVPSNLRWDTRVANMADKVKHGTAQRGERANCVKLTNEKVMAIRADATAGVSRSILAKRHGVSYSLIGQIVRRDIWAHLPEQTQGAA